MGVSVGDKDNGKSTYLEVTNQSSFMRGRNEFVIVELDPRCDSV